MARVPFIDTENHPELSELAGRISSGRRGKLINVYRTLLHSPPLAESWFNHINQVRWGTVRTAKGLPLVAGRPCGLGQLVDRFIS